MKPDELISDVPFAPGHRREALLYARLLLRYLADHVYCAELASGARVHDAIDVKRWFEELAEASREHLQKPGGSPPELRQLRQQTECPLCDHIHQGREECGAYLSELRFCKCTHRLSETTLR
jgi:hypothetical protein